MIEGIYYIRLISIDNLYREYRCEEYYRPLKIITPIAPLIERTYEFKKEIISNLYMLPQYVDENNIRKKLDEYDTVTIRIYEEKKPKLEGIA